MAGCRFSGLVLACEEAVAVRKRVRSPGAADGPASLSHDPTSTTVDKEGEPPCPVISLSGRSEELAVPAGADGAEACHEVIERNELEGVTWMHSYVSEDKTKTFCVYDGGYGAILPARASPDEKTPR